MEIIMHSKRKGNIGQLAIGKIFTDFGYSVFFECGDISKIDLIAEKNGKLIRVQCKAYTPKDNKIELSFKKSGPNYNFYYDLNEFDFFAIYDLINHNIYLINTKLVKYKKSITLKLNKSKNNQSKKINIAENYLFERVLRDYEQGTLKSDDIVQTTTEMASES
jgi:hypothetical protein